LEIVESGIEAAYGQEPDERLHGCPACDVSWFGVDAHCWVCGDLCASCYPSAVLLVPVLDGQV
jgi:hypothetical protein